MTNMFFDCKCDKCGAAWCDYIRPLDNAPLCPECGSGATHKLPGGLKHFKAKAPYDYLDKGPPDSKRVFSGPKVKSK